LSAFFDQRRRNRDFLRRVAGEVGKEIEGWPYEKLSRGAEEISFDRTIEGVSVSFSIEAYETNAAGDLHVCMDVDAAIPTLWPTKPSYVFWKRKDGSCYY
jgi:hypothetical protein